MKRYLRFLIPAGLLVVVLVVLLVVLNSNLGLLSDADGADRWDRGCRRAAPSARRASDARDPRNNLGGREFPGVGRA